MLPQPFTSGAFFSLGATFSVSSHTPGELQKVISPHATRRLPGKAGPSWPVPTVCQLPPILAMGTAGTQERGPAVV